MSKKKKVHEGTWTSALKMSSPGWGLAVALKQSWRQCYFTWMEASSLIAILRDPILEPPVVAKWWPRASWGKNSLPWNEFHQCRLTQPTTCMNMYVTVDSCKTVKKGPHWRARTLRWESPKPFWNWLAKKTWSKEDFQISIRGSQGHAHARSSEGDVANEWYPKEHGNHSRNPPSGLKSFVSVQMVAFLSTCQYKYILDVLENLKQ